MAAEPTDEIWQPQPDEQVHRRRRSGNEALNAAPQSLLIHAVFL
jgi:hypothetical protein